MTEPPTMHSILVVDDDPFIGSLLLRGLEPEGFRVRVVHDGLEALDQVRLQPPDLILLDIDLPGMQGDDICRRLKSSPDTPLIPTVILTALAAFHTQPDAWP